jgi:hypothetical protein
MGSWIQGRFLADAPDPLSERASALQASEPLCGKLESASVTANQGAFDETQT